MVTLYLVRHGQARRTRGRCIGHADVALSAGGRSTIERLARRLAAAWSVPPDRITTSDLRRAAESARLLAAPWRGSGLDIRPEPRLRELAFGEWEGRRWREIMDAGEAECERWAREWVTHGPPRGESFNELVRRVAEWIEAIRAEEHTGAAPPVVMNRERHLVVAHAGSIRAVLAHCLGWSPARVFAEPVGHGQLTVLDLTRAGARLRIAACDIQVRAPALGIVAGEPLVSGCGGSRRSAHSARSS